VFLTHNHFPAERSQCRGLLPVNRIGTETQVSISCLPDYEFTPATEKWSRERTHYQVMLKTLQQARVERVWQPALDYTYNWAGQMYLCSRSSKKSMIGPLDVGVLQTNSNAGTNFRSRRLYPSTKVRDVVYGSTVSVLGFPGTNPIVPTYAKSKKQLEQVPLPSLRRNPQRDFISFLRYH
jgi:hypothetical protein